MLGNVNQLFVFKSLFTKPSNVLPLHLNQTFPPIIWIFTEGEGDAIESRLPFKIFSTLKGSEGSFQGIFHLERHLFPETSLKVRSVLLHTAFSRLLKNATINIGLLTVVFTSLKKHHIDFLSDRNSKKVTIEANTYPKNQSQNDLVDIWSWKFYLV